MFKILLVDDEKIVRIGLKTIIKWNENGFELVGEAKDGISALSLIDTNKPDIIITDLKMPNLDGIGLIRKLKEKEYKGKILVLSNYGEFEMVREAMKLGASDYILKLTMKSEELLKTLKQMGEQLNKERKQDEENINTKIVLNQTKAIAKNDFFKKIIESEVLSINDTLKQADTLGISFGKTNLMLYILIDKMEFMISEGKIKDKKLNSISILNIMYEILSNQGNTKVVGLNYKEFAVILDTEFINERNKTVNKLAHEIADTIKMYTNVTVSIAVSSEMNCIASLHETYKVCRSAIKFKFYTGNGSVINVKDAVFGSYNLKHYYFNFISKAKQNMEAGNIEELILLFKGFINEASEKKYNIQNFKKMISVSIYDLDSVLIKWGENDLSRFDGLKLKLEQSETLEDYKTCLFNLLKEANSALADLKTHRYSREINQVINYINKNISNRLTLSMIAKEINLNESYLCRTFKNETGKNFVDFVYEIKMEKAKELLQNPDYMIKEVATSLGFDDQFYFNRIFNKYVGLSPSEYKTKIFGK